MAVFVAGNIIEKGSRVVVGLYDHSRALADDVTPQSLLALVLGKADRRYERGGFVNSDDLIRSGRSVSIERGNDVRSTSDRHEDRRCFSDT